MFSYPKRSVFSGNNSIGDLSCYFSLTLTFLSLHKKMKLESDDVMKLILHIDVRSLFKRKFIFIVEYDVKWFMWLFQYDF